MTTVQSADGTKIAYDQFGDGQPLILVLGGLADRTAATGIAELLGKDLAVFAYDRRGRGDSGDTLPYAVEREVEDLAAMIAAAGGEAYVFGHSSGAVLALEAAMGGLPISKLVVYEPPYIVDGTRDRPSNLGARVSALIDAGQPGDAVKLFMKEGPEAPPEVIDAMAASPAWPAMEAIAPTLPYDLAICGDQRIPDDRLAKIAIPTLALSGGASAQWARTAVDAVAGAIPRAEQVSLAGQTHGAVDDVLAPVLAKFFSS